MNYSLAKELKDVGFPHECTEIDETTETIPYCIYESDGICQPPLEELIEACGERFEKLTVLHDQNKWTAYSTVENEACYSVATTSKEAVARLWLALNKKS